MGQREILLLSAGVFLIVLVVWRQNQLDEWKNDPSRQVATIRTLAPRFTLADHNRKVVKLERLLGRHRVVIAFFDADLGVDQDPRTKSLLKNFDAIDQAGIEIIAVSTATPFANEEAERRLGRELPFPVLTDIDMTNPQPTPAHREYGLVESDSGKVKTGLFMIERDGSLSLDKNGLATPVADEQSALAALSKGEWYRPPAQLPQE